MILCFDIGGSWIRAAAAHAPDDIRPLSRQPTPRHDFDAFTAVLAGCLADVGRPERIVLSLAGATDPDTGRARIANIPCLDGRPLAADLQAALGLPVLVANDADCFALAEAGQGAGRGHEVVFGAILGTGIGGGLVVGGRLIHGAGEWGHGPVAARVVQAVPQVLPAFPCGCGLSGCLDAVCSARGIERLHAHLAAETLASTEILARWHADDPAATRTVAAWLEILSAPLAMIVNLTAAGIVPTGGGLAGDPRCWRRWTAPPDR